MFALLAGCADKTIDHSDTVSETLYQSAIDAQKKGDYASAVSYYRKLHVRHPGDLGVLLELAISLRYIGSSAEAAALLSKNSEKFADKPAFLMELGKLKLAEGNAKEALGYLQTAQEKAPENWEIYSATGIAYDMLTLYGKAMESYQTALDISPGNPTVLNNMAISAAQSGNIDRAISILTTASKISRKNPQIRQNLALFHGIKGDLKEAEALARMDLDEEAVRNNLAFYYMFNKKKQEKAPAK